MRAALNQSVEFREFFKVVLDINLTDLGSVYAYCFPASVFAHSRVSHAFMIV